MVLRNEDSDEDLELLYQVECSLPYEYRRELDFHLQGIKFAIEVGSVATLERLLAAECLAESSIASNPHAQEAITRANVWLDEARSYEAIHGKKSMLNR